MRRKGKFSDALKGRSDFFSRVGFDLCFCSNVNCCCSLLRCKTKFGQEGQYVSETVLDLAKL